MERFGAMTSWKGLYSNVDVLDLGPNYPRAHEQSSQPGIKDCPKVVEEEEEENEKESIYEAVDPATGVNGNPTKQVAAAMKLPCTRRRIMLAGAALLATSVLLNVLLLTLGIVHYSKMVDVLEQVRTENKMLQKAVPSSFLLYNENHKLCVDRQLPRYLTAVPCDPEVPTQHFQWLPRGLILHVASQLCVAASVAQSTAAIFLQPCNDRSSLQLWECREQDLLALNGKDLYFNYGNNINKVVMLYNRNGPWSRWIIYGTNSNICSTCIPFAKTRTFFQESYYFFSNSPGTWDEANQSCTSMGAHLVTINTAEEKVHLVTIMSVSSWWIGLTDRLRDGDWKWVDGSSFSVGNSHWHQDEPNGGRGENCALMKNGLWFDYPCKERHPWVCEGKS